MAQLMLIKEASLSAVDNRHVNDIVGIFPDDHVFSAHEKLIFTIVQVKDTKKSVLEAQAAQITEVKEAYRAKTTGWTLEEPERTQVWKDGTDWKEIKVAPRFTARYEDGQIKENFSRYVENTVPLILGSATKES